MQAMQSKTHALLSRVLWCPRQSWPPSQRCSARHTPASPPSGCWRTMKNSSLLMPAGGTCQ
eukprot:10296160-Lingulodinium_polyedra.AAC.1